jgi:hypothetical protein
VLLLHPQNSQDDIEITTERGSDISIAKRSEETSGIELKLAFVGVANVQHETKWPCLIPM